MLELHRRRSFEGAVSLNESSVRSAVLEPNARGSCCLRPSPRPTDPFQSPSCTPPSQHLSAVSPRSMASDANGSASAKSKRSLRFDDLASDSRSPSPSIDRPATPTRPLTRRRGWSVPESEATSAVSLLGLGLEADDRMLTVLSTGVRYPLGWTVRLPLLLPPSGLRASLSPGARSRTSQHAGPPHVLVPSQLTACAR